MKRYWNKYGAYYGDIARLSVPIMVAQLGTIVTGYADTMMVGHYSTEALASASFVNNVFTLVIMLSLGFSYGITPLVGALFAKGSLREAGATLRTATVANAIYGALVLAAMVVFYFCLGLIGQPEHLLPLIREYYVLILVSMVPVVFTHVMRQFADATGHTSLGMWIFTGGNVVNIAGNYALIYGHFGAPEMGLMGAGWATLVSRILICLVYAAVIISSKRYRPYCEGFASARSTLKGLRAMAAQSLPISLQLGTETAIFTVAGIVVGWLGAHSMAAYQILVIFGSIGFMIYYAIGAGMAIKVAHFKGTTDMEGVRRAVHAGYALTLVCTAVACGVFLTLGHSIIAMFTLDETVIAIATGMLWLLVLYQLGDATQIAFSGALRGIGLVKPMMTGALIAYVVIGVPLIFLLGHPSHLGLKGVYLAFFVSLLAAGIIFWWHFKKECRTQK
ncbi:MAG: MATE family efflux transporter [Bacteroidales bacterium]|nr:MATE family efflux transporter [Bacteroidales bacterium]